jgi:hypothetical protein
VSPVAPPAGVVAVGSVVVVAGVEAAGVDVLELSLPLFLSLPHAGRATARRASTGMTNRRIGRGRLVNASYRRA